MTNTLLTLKTRDDRPVAATIVCAIREVRKSSDELGFSVFLVGATARIVLLEHVFGLSAGRTSHDVDFAFALENWQQFHTLKRYLIQYSHFEEIRGETQRLFFVSPDERYKIFVDLIPFGGIESKNNSIAWPPDMSVIMNVSGYSDALAAAINVEIVQGLIIPVASLAGMVILKLFAWSDRGRENPKDAIDFVLLLRGYYDAGNRERIYEDAVATFESVDYDPELAGAWLLGKDAADIAAENTRDGIVRLLKDENRFRHLIQDMSRGIPAKPDALGYSEAMLKQFILGFKTRTLIS